MKEAALTMKYEIRAIAGYKALIISKVYIMVMLGITSIIYGLFHYNQSPLYILIVLLILPPFIENMPVKSEAGANRFLKAFEETPFLLNSLRIKYKYKKRTHLAQSIAYLVGVLLILLWQFNNDGLAIFRDFLIYVPSYILITGIILRFLIIIIYRFKLPYDLENNIA